MLLFPMNVHVFKYAHWMTTTLRYSYQCGISGAKGTYFQAQMIIRSVLLSIKIWQCNMRLFCLDNFIFLGGNWVAFWIPSVTYIYIAWYRNIKIWHHHMELTPQPDNHILYVCEFSNCFWWFANFIFNFKLPIHYINTRRICDFTYC